MGFSYNVTFKIISKSKNNLNMAFIIIIHCIADEVFPVLPAHQINTN